MNLQKIVVLVLLCWTTESRSQYANYVEAKVSTIDNQPFGLLKMSRKDNHVKVKYFAAKDFDGTTVYERYQKWAIGKKVIAYSSGTYMNDCYNPGYATPIGLCVDQGTIVNRELVNDRLDALAIVYATGGMVVSNLDDGNVKITSPGSTQKTLNIRDNAYHKSQFISWAEQQEATVFQTHLFVFEDQIKIANNSSKTKAMRRFLAACKSEYGDVVHYIINLSGESTEYNGVKKAFRILKEIEEVQQIVYMINLDTGCQDVFSAFNQRGTAYTSDILTGTTPLAGAVNLLAYYYE